VNRESLIDQIQRKHSFLCIGLDTDPEKIPVHLLESEDPVYEFNQAIIEATQDLCVAYKPNTAFYEQYGKAGWEALEKTIAYIPNDLFVIADAKRADIGNTSDRYARAFFEGMQADAITLHPYMGYDSIAPFLKYEDKWAILLALTSNPGSQDFQRLLLADSEEQLFEKVLRVTREWAGPDKLMYVVGATHPEAFRKIRAIVPDHFLLVPGVGAQGGTVAEVARYGMNKDIGLLINASRSIIYASDGEDFADAAREEAKKLQSEMAKLIA
jgi:orotidine-5'-phosphate decarboxylase